MKQYCHITLIVMRSFFSFCLKGLCQLSEYSEFFRNSEKWPVKQNKEMLGLGKPEFGNFVTIHIGRSSPVIKKKTKDSTVLDYDITRAGVDIDQNKFLTVKKSKTYQLKLVTGTDTIEASFRYHQYHMKKNKPF